MAITRRMEGWRFGWKVVRVPSCENIRWAWAKVSARKKTQQAQTKWNVATTPRSRPQEKPGAGGAGRRGALGSFARARRARQSWNIFVTARAAPCRPPQTTKVQDAPCQRPPRSIVIIRFRYVRTLPRRLPPREMYR